MHIRSFMIGSTVDTPHANPELQELAALFAFHTFRALWMRIPAHAFRHASMSMMGRSFSIVSTPSAFSIGKMISLFQEHVMQPPCSAAFAISLYDSSAPSGGQFEHVCCDPAVSSGLALCDVFPVPRPFFLQDR